jgi:heme/copper-type cytochrome/quinol oxidase subunit 4
MTHNSIHSKATGVIIAIALTLVAFATTLNHLNTPTTVGYSNPEAEKYIVWDK